MHINKSHRARVEWFSIGLAAVLGMGGPVCAEPVVGLSDTPSSTGPVDAGAWPDGVETPAMDGGDDDGTINTATGAAALPVVRGGARPWRPAQAGQSGGSLFPVRAEVMAAGESEDEAWRREVASTVRDAVRPAYEGLASSGILDAVRIVESELGLGRGPSFNDVLSDDSAHNTGHGARPESASWAGVANRADTFNRPRSSAQIADDERNASMLMQQLIDEVKPWAFSLIALYVLGYAVKLALDYSQWKAARRRQRIATGRRRKRHKRRPTT